MKLFNLVVLLMFASGCNGEAFTTLAAPQDAPDSMGVETGGAPGTGGSPNTGGVRAASGGGGSVAATGGAPEVDAGGGAPISTGGASATGGAPEVDAAPLVPCDGAGLSTHDNGLGQTWQDCVPLGTYDEAQAKKACAAYTGDVQKCATAPGCGNAPWIVQGTDGTTYNYIWGYAGNTAGFVGVNGGCPSSGQGWN